MAYSMTGWGSCRTPKFTLNIRGLNSKYKEIILHAPQEFFEAEPFIHRFLSDSVSRGRVDIYVNIEKTNLKKKLKVNRQLFRQSLAELKKLGAGDISAEVILSNVEGVMSVQDAGAKEFTWAKIKPALAAAAADFKAMKKKEGSRLAADILKRLAEVEAGVSAVKKAYPAFREAGIKRTRERIKKILDKETKSRFVNSEIAEALDKLDINEEIVRIFSHVKQARSLLRTKPVCGRKIDFIAQEIYREANTMVSKVNDPAITNKSIGIKEATEKIREQSMNLE